MKNLNKLWSLLLVAITLSACSKTTTIRHHEMFKDHLSQSKQLTILPAAVHVVTVDAAEKKTRNYEYESQVEDIIIDILKPELAAKGYKTTFLNRREIHNNKLSRNVLNFREEYNSQIEKLYSPFAWNLEKAHNVDVLLTRKLSEVTKLNGSELVIFVEYDLKARSSGACTKDFALALFSSALGASSNQEPAELVSVIFAIIDPNDGRFIWSNFSRTPYGTFSGMFTKNDKYEAKRLKEVFAELLKELPARDKL